MEVSPSCSEILFLSRTHYKAKDLSVPDKRVSQGTSPPRSSVAMFRVTQRSARTFLAPAIITSLADSRFPSSILGQTGETRAGISPRRYEALIIKIKFPAARRGLMWPQRAGVGTYVHVAARMYRERTEKRTVPSSMYTYAEDTYVIPTRAKGSER